MQSTFNAGLAYAEYRQLLHSYRAAALVAFTMSTYFVVGYLAGSLLFWMWSIEQGMNGFVGVGICLVMTAYQFVLYARGDVKGGKKATIVAVCVAVGFSALSEIGQGMERDHVRMESKSLESPTYKAVVGQVGNASGATAHPYSTQLSRAQMKLARCEKNVSAGIWSDCVESTARLESVKNMINDHHHQNQLSSQAMAKTAKEMEKDESNYHPLVNLIKGGLGTTGAVGSFILSMILIGFFEYAFHYLGRQLAAARNDLLINGYDVTRKKRKIPLAFYRVANKKPLPPVDTWNGELSKSGIDSPDDDVLNQAANPEQIKRIVGTGQSVQDNASGRTVYGSGVSNGNEENTTEQSHSDRTVYSQGSAKAVDMKTLYPAIYQVIKERIINGDIRPTVRPATDAVLVFLKENGKQWGIKSTAINKPARQAIAQKALEQLEGESIVKRNPDGGVGKPKYILVGHNDKLGIAETQLDMLSGEEVKHD